jgi:hypothetical protein
MVWNEEAARACVDGDLGKLEIRAHLDETGVAVALR